MPIRCNKLRARHATLYLIVVTCLASAFCQHGALAQVDGERTNDDPADAKALAGKKENHPIWDLMKVRECDRVGMKKKEAPFRLRKYFAMIEEALRDPISVGQLKINGEFMIKELGIKPGPRMGWILNALLEEVLDAPEKNSIGHLSELVKSLNMLGDEELRTLGERGKGKKEGLEEEEVAKLHKKHGVN